jgi:hypothetical protein
MTEQKHERKRRGNARSHIPAIALLTVVLWPGWAPAEDASSLGWAVWHGMMRLGATQPLSHVSAALTPGLSPVPAEVNRCLSDAREELDAVSLALLCEGAGLRVEALPVQPGSWNRAMVRQYLRTRALSETLTNIVLLQGGWRLPVPTHTWGDVLPLDTPLMLEATTQVGQVTCVAGPRTMVILSVTNSSRAPAEQRRAVLRAAAEMLSGRPLGSPYAKAGWLYGAAALEQVADLAHRWPWCMECKDASRMCVRPMLQAWQSQLEALSTYARAASAGWPEWRRDALGTAAEQIDAARAALAPLSEYKVVRAACESPMSQARLGEELRVAAVHMTNAASMLVYACDAPRTLVTLANPLPPWPDNAWLLASRVPLFVEMPDAYDSLMCVIQILGRVLDNEENLAILRAAAGMPFAFLIDTNACVLPPSMTWANGGTDNLLNALGCSAVMYACDANAPEAGQRFIQATIARAISAGTPVPAYELDGYPGWSIILGYTNHGRGFLARTPADRTSELRVCKAVPSRLLIVQTRRMPTRRAIIRNALRRAVMLYDSADMNGYACGRAAWQWYRAQLAWYGEMQVIPGPVVVAGSQTLWNWLITTRRQAHEFLSLALMSEPGAAIILGQARACYIRSEDILTLARTDEAVLKSSDEDAATEWLISGYTRQLDALDAAFAQEEEAVGHLRNALLQIEGQ